MVKQAKKKVKKKAKRYTNLSELKSPFNELNMKICPKCKSSDVNIDKNPLQPAFGLPAFYTCGDCGFSGHMFPEVELDKLEEFEKEVDKRGLRNLEKEPHEKVDRSYGNFFVDVVWRYGGPVTMLVGLILIIRMSYLGALLLIGGGLASFLSLRKKRRKYREAKLRGKLSGA